MRNSYRSKIQKSIRSLKLSVSWIYRGGEQSHYNLGIITYRDVCYLNIVSKFKSFQSTQCLPLPFIHPKVTLCTSLSSPNRHPVVCQATTDFCKCLCHVYLNRSWPFFPSTFQSLEINIWQVELWMLWRSVLGSQIIKEIYTHIYTYPPLKSFYKYITIIYM